jgi:Tol biopolymer transport system component
MNYRSVAFRSHILLAAKRKTIAATSVFLAITFAAGCGGGGGAQPPNVPALDRIVYQSTAGGDAEIVIMNGDGTGQTPLTNNTAFDGDPKFNRAGNKIVFTSNRDGNNEIYIMDADGKNPVNITKNAASDSDPAFSPDGSKIVFVSDRNRTGPSLPSELEIYVMNVNGSEPTRLTNNAAFDGDPVFSLDGRRVIYSSRQDNNEEIYQVDLAQKIPRNLTQNPAVDRFPNVTPSGRIIFVSDRSTNSEIHIMDADGKNVANLTQNPAPDTDGAVSPDGQRLIFSSVRPGTLDIFSMPLDRSAAPKPLTNVAGSERFPDVR